jgi:hypothetical protein
LRPSGPRQRRLETQSRISQQADNAAQVRRALPADPFGLGQGVENSGIARRPLHEHSRTGELEQRYREGVGNDVVDLGGDPAALLASRLEG